MASCSSSEVSPSFHLSFTHFIMLSFFQMLAIPRHGLRNYLELHNYFKDPLRQLKLHLRELLRQKDPVKSRQ